MKSKIIFADEKIKSFFERLKDAKSEEKQLHSSLVVAFEILEKNAFAGTQIPKRLIPKEYKKRFGEIDNLWKLNLPNAWRLLYSVKGDKIVIISLILEWISHKEYEKRFKY
jgi:hypothetical protein